MSDTTLPTPSARARAVLAREGVDTPNEQQVLLAEVVAADEQLRAAMTSRSKATALRDSAVLAAHTAGVPVGVIAQAIKVAGPVISRIITRNTTPKETTP